MKQNEHRIQCEEKFAVDRLDWTTLDNISQMYDIIYNEIIDAKIAKKIEDAIFMDRDGKLVDELNCFG